MLSPIGTVDDGTNTSGALTLPRVDGSNFERAYESFATEIGATYEAIIPVGSVTAISRIGTGIFAGTQTVLTANETAKITFVATATTTFITLYSNANDSVATVGPSISVKKVPYPNLNPNSTFDDATGYTLSASAPPSISAGVLDFAANSGGSSQAAINVVAADCSWHLAMFYASKAGELYVRVNQGDFAIHTVSAGWNLVYVRSGSGNTQFLIRANQVNDYTGTVDNLQLYELPASIDRKYLSLIHISEPTRPY